MYLISFFWASLKAVKASELKIKTTLTASTRADVETGAPAFPQPGSTLWHIRGFPSYVSATCDCSLVHFGKTVCGVPTETDRTTWCAKKVQKEEADSTLHRRNLVFSRIWPHLVTSVIVKRRETLSVTSVHFDPFGRILPSFATADGATRPGKLRLYCSFLQPRLWCLKTRWSNAEVLIFLPRRAEQTITKQMKTFTSKTGMWEVQPILQHWHFRLSSEEKGIISSKSSLFWSEVIWVN